MLCITNTLIKHQSFVYIQLFDQTVIFLAIQFIICNLLFKCQSTQFISQFYFNHRWQPIRCYHIVLPHVQMSFLKFTSCDNQALLGCIPIAAVAVHLNLNSCKLVSHHIRCIAITYWISNSLRQFQMSAQKKWFQFI